MPEEVMIEKGEKSKYRLARAMKECMKSASVENTTVRQITEQCGLTRQTFYRNFLDKYDLINWYFDKLLAKSSMPKGLTASTGMDARELDRRVIYDARLWLDSGKIFGKTGEGFQRINAATSRAILLECLERIKSLFPA